MIGNVLMMVALGGIPAGSGCATCNGCGTEAVCYTRYWARVYGYPGQPEWDWYSAVVSNAWVPELAVPAETTSPEAAEEETEPAAPLPAVPPPATVPVPPPPPPVRHPAPEPPPPPAPLRSSGSP